MSLKTPMTENLAEDRTGAVQNGDTQRHSLAPRPSSSAGRSRPVVGLAVIWGEGRALERGSPVARLAQVWAGACENLWRAPISSIVTSLTIAGAVFLLGLFLLVLENGTSALSRRSEGVAISIFLRDQASSEDVQEVAHLVGPLVSGRPVVYTDKARALENFRTLLGPDAGILEGVEADNPLPASLEVALDTPDQVEAVYQVVEGAEGKHRAVEAVRFSRGVVQQLRRLLSVCEVAGVIGAIVLLVITAFIIANTIKLALYAHRLEVEIMRLLGARLSTIYAPFVLEGVLQGVFGAAVGVGVVFGVFVGIRNVVERSDLLRAFLPHVLFLSYNAVVGCLAVGAGVGMVGSILALRRFSERA